MNGRRMLPASALSGARVWLAFALLVFSLLTLGISSPGYAATDARGEPGGAWLGRQVNDLTGTLSAEQIQAIEARLQALEREKGAQIGVLMIKSTDGEPIEAYAVKRFESWKLGRQGVDDGILLLVAKDDRALRIEVGYGLEGAVTDAQANRIIQERIVPRFAQGDFAGGIEAGVDSLIGLVRGEALPPPVIQRESAGNAGSSSSIPWELLIGMGIVLLSVPVWSAAFAGAVLGFIFFNGFKFILVGAVLGSVVSMLGRLFMNGRGVRSDTASRRGRSRGAFGAGLGTGGFAGGSRSSRSSSSSRGSSGGFSGGGGRSGGGGASGRW